MSGSKTFFNISENMPTDIGKSFFEKTRNSKKDKAMLHVISKKISLSFILDSDSDFAFITRSAGSTFHRLTWTGTIVPRGFQTKKLMFKCYTLHYACPVGILVFASLECRSALQTDILHTSCEV